MSSSVEIGGGPAAAAAKGGARRRGGGGGGGGGGGEAPSELRLCRPRSSRPLRGSSLLALPLPLLRAAAARKQQLPVPRGLEHVREDEIFQGRGQGRAGLHGGARPERREEEAGEGPGGVWRWRRRRPPRHRRRRCRRARTLPRASLLRASPFSSLPRRPLSRQDR